jgi:hypothetical protein
LVSIAISDVLLGLLAGNIDYTICFTPSNVVEWDFP